jgi:hypothetical protein
MNRVTAGDAALATLLDPVSVATFAADYWERRPLHVARDVPGYFADVFDVADVEDALLAGARDLERFALVRAGHAQAPLEAYAVSNPGIRPRATGKPPTAQIDPRKVLALFADGYTLVVKDAGALCARLQRWCNRLQHDLCAYAGANVYFTPPGAQGFDLHHDSHDTLTVQIEGTKMWRIYEPAVELPLESQPLHRETERPPLRLLDEIALGAGDTLYLPRGYAHDARAGERRALHVTFALAPVRAIDLLHAALDLAAQRDVGLRRSLPLGWQNDPAFGADFATALAPRLGALFGPQTASAAAAVALDDLFAASRSDAGGAFGGLAGLADLCADSVLSLNVHLPHVVRASAAAVELLVPGKTLGFPVACGAALDQLRAGSVRFDALDLPLSEDDRRRFVASLVREGLVLIHEV